MTERDLLFLQALMDRLLRRGYRRAYRAIPRKSGGLRKGLSYQMFSPFRGRLHVPHYYARYVHDGRRAQNRGPGQVPFIWFRNPKLDPRLDNGMTPERVRDLRHLTREQFIEARDRGLLIITRRTGPTQGQPFFSNDPGGGMEGFRDEAGKIVLEAMHKHVRATLGRDFNRKGTIRIRL